MEIFDIFVNNIIGQKTIIPPTMSDFEKRYVASFYQEDGTLDKNRVYSEMNRFIAQMVVDEEEEWFFSLMESLLACVGIDIDYNIVDMLGPLLVAFKPRLSELLTRSFMFCPNFTYQSGPVNKWAERNELVLHELEFWRYFLDLYGDYIEIDSDIYLRKEVVSKRQPIFKGKEHDTKEKVKQLYSWIIHS